MHVAECDCCLLRCDKAEKAGFRITPYEFGKRFLTYFSATCLRPEVTFNPLAQCLSASRSR